MRGVLLEPLPFPEPAQLVNVWETQAANDTHGVAPANVLDWRAAGRFEGLAAYNRHRRSLAGDVPVHVIVATVSANEALAPPR